MNDKTKWENAHFEHDANPVDGSMSKPAAAQEAVWELAKKVRTELDRASCPDAFMRLAVEAVMEHAAAPVAVAPTLDAELAQDRMSELCELERDVLDSLPAVYYMDPPDGGNVSLGEQVKRMAEDAALWRKHSNTPAAPGIDLEQFRPLIKLGMTWGPGSRYRIAAESLAAKIDTSPKGVTMHNDGSSEAQLIADAERLNCTVCGGSGHVDDTPKGGSNVVSEYIAARDAYEEAVKPSGGFGQPKRLCHSDPIILRYRNARTALNALQATSAEVGA